MSIFDSIGKGLGKVYHAVTGVPTSKEVRQQKALVNDQVKAYREQTELTRAELNRVQGEQVAEKRRIQEKQIRSLRNNYQPQGLLGGQAPVSNDMASRLGG